MNFTAGSISILTCIFPERHPGIWVLVNYFRAFGMYLIIENILPYARFTCEPLGRTRPERVRRLRIFQNPTARLLDVIPVYCSALRFRLPRDVDVTTGETLSFFQLRSYMFEYVIFNRAIFLIASWNNRGTIVEGSSQCRAEIKTTEQLNWLFEVSILSKSASVESLIDLPFNFRIAELVSWRISQRNIYYLK